MCTELTPTRWYVDEMIPEGVLLFAAKAKHGKTTLMMHLCASMAAGTPALGSLSTQQCEILYLALEDNERRVQRRMRKMLQNEATPSGFHIAYSWPRMDQGGLQALETYCAEHPKVGIIVIDTLARIRPARRYGGGYDDDYASVNGLTELAAQYQIAIVVLHHLRKAPADDPFDEINASIGLMAAVDNMLVMRRGQDDLMEVYRRGRECEDETPLALQGDTETLCWRLAGKLADVKRSAERVQILELLRENPGGMTPSEIAGALNKNLSTVKTLLSKMLRERIPPSKSQGGRYFSVPE